MQLEHYILDLDDKIQLNPNQLIVTKIQSHQEIIQKINRFLPFDFHDRSLHYVAMNNDNSFDDKNKISCLPLHHDA